MATTLAETLRATAQEAFARRDLLEFAKRVSPGFQTPKHIVYLAKLLERVERGEIKRLAISVAPGCGKSTLLQCAGAFFLGRNGRRRLLCISAAESLAKRNSRDTQALVESDGWPFDVSIKSDSVLDWTLNKGGEVHAIGYGGTVTGFRAEGIIVDDLQKDAGTDQSRKDCEEWFRGVLSTRLEPNGWCVVIQTRWHDGDIIGRLAEGESADQWTVVNLPAIAGEDDVLGRKPGEPLWPERWPLSALLAIKAEVGSSQFAAQYIGAPSPAEGNLIKREWLRYYTQPPAEFDRVVLAIDAASKTGISNDFSAIVAVGLRKREFFVLDCVVARVELPQLRRLTVGMFEKHNPSSVYVEDTSNGIGLIQGLRQDTTLPIVPVKVKGSKISRVEGTSGLYESGRVYFPEQAGWRATLEDQCLRFPASAHDDAVDALTIALSRLRKLTQYDDNWSFAFAKNAPIKIEGALGRRLA